MSIRPNLAHEQKFASPQARLDCSNKPPKPQSPNIWKGYFPLVLHI